MATLTVGWCFNCWIGKHDECRRQVGAHCECHKPGVNHRPNSPEADDGAQ